MKKLVTFLTTAILAIACVGCSTNASNNSSSSSSSGFDNPNGLDFTEYKLVDNGTSEYKIVLPDEPTEYEEEASWEMEDFFKEATSVKLKTVSESEVTYSDTAKLILLGNTQYTDKTGVDVSKIPDDGFTVKTVGSNLFILGEDAGVIYGVYDFLEKVFEYEYYVANVYALNKNVNEMYMPKLDVSDAPDIAYRTDAWGAESAGTTRARLCHYNSPFMFYCMTHAHNTMQWLPPETYRSTHSAWYASSGQQLCYTAHGSATELAAMQGVVLEKCKEQVNYYFGRGEYLEAISFTQNEGTTGGWCSCSACTAEKNTYGASSASIIRFLNPVAREFKAWLAETYPGHEVKIVFLAYQYSEAAPVKTVNGEIVPTDESVVMEDNLSVWLAPIYGDYSNSILDSRNQALYNSFKNWSVIAKELYVWAYDTNYSNYIMWYDSLDALPDLYKYIKQFNVRYMFNQGQLASNNRNLTGFDALKVALNSKLMWDCDTDVEAFTDRFFKTWFGVASEDMRKYYDSFMEWSRYIKTQSFYNGGLYFTGFTGQHYPFAKLQEWQGYIEDAYASIEGLETTDPELYEDLYTRISAENLTIQYALIKIHSSEYYADEYWDLKVSFKETATDLGIVLFGEWQTMDSLYNSWGV